DSADRVAGRAPGRNRSSVSSAKPNCAVRYRKDRAAHTASNERKIISSPDAPQECIQAFRYLFGILCVQAMAGFRENGVLGARNAAQERLLTGERDHPVLRAP